VVRGIDPTHVLRAERVLPNLENPYNEDPMTTSDTGRFYDLRGDLALRSDDPSYGSNKMPLHVAEPYRYVEGLLSKLRERGASRLLDICCGTGVHSIYPAKVGYTVMGVDISPKSIMAARQLAALNEVSDTCQFEVQDAIDRLSSQEQFDVILISGSWYYLPRDQTLELVSQRLTAGGHFICIETYGGNQMMKLYRHARARLRRDRDQETLRNLLGVDEIRYVAGHFENAAVTFFDCSTLFGVFLGRRTLAASYHRLSKHLDDFLLNRLNLRGLAFKFVIDAAKATAPPENPKRPSTGSLA